jgi:hypothetical protein
MPPKSVRSLTTRQLKSFDKRPKGTPGSAGRGITTCADSKVGALLQPALTRILLNANASPAQPVSQKPLAAVVAELLLINMPA